LALERKRKIGQYKYWNAITEKINPKLFFKNDERVLR
jgi:hypothetical protein